MHNVQVFPLIGLPQFNGWSQVVVAHDQTVICALAVQGQNAGNIGRDLVGQLQNQSLSSAAAFYETLQTIVAQTKELDVTLFCAGAYLQGQTATYVTFNGTLILKRQAKVGQLLSSENQLKVIQGQFLPDDLLVLATNTTQGFFGEIQQKATQGYEAEVIMNSLISAVHTHTESATMSLAFLALVPEETEPTLVPEMTSLPLQSSSIPEAMNVPEDDVSLSTPPTPTGPLKSIHLDEEIPAATAPSISATEPVPGPRRTSAQQVKPVITQVSRRLLHGLKRTSQWLVTVFSRIVALVNRRRSLGTQPELPDVFISHQGVHQRLKVLVPVIIILVVALLGFWYWRSQRQKQFEAGQQTSLPLVASFEAAEGKLAEDPVGSRAEMQRIITELEALHVTNSSRPAVQAAIDEKLSTLRQKYDAVSGKEQRDELPVFFDLSSIQANFVTTKVANLGQTAVFIDGDTKQAIVLDLLTKQARLISLSPLPALNDVSVQNTQLLSLGNGIYQFDLAAEATGSSEKVLVAEGDSNREAKLLASFSDYLYVINPVRRNIYRYLREADSVSDPIGWLKPGQPLPYDELSSFRVDGDVWLSTKTGEIWKLSLGEKADYVVTGLSEPFTQSLLLDTQPDWQNLYVLESASRRVVVLSKTGQFVKEIKSSSLASATHIIAHEPDGLVLAVSGSVVFEMRL